MKFGFRNAPETFQRALDIRLSGDSWRSSLVYFKDVNMFYTSTVKHVNDFEEIVSLLKKAGLSLKLKNVPSLNER